MLGDERDDVDHPGAGLRHRRRDLADMMVVDGRDQHRVDLDGEAEARRPRDACELVVDQPPPGLDVPFTRLRLQAIIGEIRPWISGSTELTVTVSVVTPAARQRVDALGQHQTVGRDAKRQFGPTGVDAGECFDGVARGQRIAWPGDSDHRQVRHQARAARSVVATASSGESSRAATPGLCSTRLKSRRQKAQAMLQPGATGRCSRAALAWPSAVVEKQGCRPSRSGNAGVIAAVRMMCAGQALDCVRAHASSRSNNWA